MSVMTSKIWFFQKFCIFFFDTLSLLDTFLTKCSNKVIMTIVIFFWNYTCTFHFEFILCIYTVCYPIGKYCGSFNLKVQLNIDFISKSTYIILFDSNQIPSAFHEIYLFIWTILQLLEFDLQTLNRKCNTYCKINSLNLRWKSLVINKSFWQRWKYTSNI